MKSMCETPIQTCNCTLSGSLQRIVLAFHLAETIAALFRHVLHHPSKVLCDPETEPLFLPLFWFYPIYREMLNSASRHRPSKSMELRRAASGLVKVICRTEESRPNGRGKKPGKPKQKGLLASFEEWFGSINMMNILYVWFPASWGPSVVEAIQTRNVTCLAKKPTVRDPHIFDRKEAARGSRAREVTCRFFLARCCLGQVPGGAPFSQRSEQAPRSHLSDPKVEHQGRGFPSYLGSKCKS